MNRRREENDRSSNKRRVLQGYRQEGKRFIPPFLQHMPIMAESRWMDDRVPELIWIALLNHVFGPKVGTAIALSVAKAAAKCDGTAKRAFASISDYVELSDEQRHCIRSEVSEEEMLDKAGQGLGSLDSQLSRLSACFLVRLGPQ